MNFTIKPSKTVGNIRLFHCYNMRLLIQKDLNTKSYQYKTMYKLFILNRRIALLKMQPTLQFILV